ncbi:hypothetical protein V7794_04550 [Rhizobium laguerreae]|nr:hypothetical protein [Rhizobium laguerreae]MBY3252672.1 hypothetical protein [Rhizobium laguerreae]
MDITPAVVIAGIVENERQHGQARGSITLRIVNQELRAFVFQKFVVSDAV